MKKSFMFYLLVALFTTDASASNRYPTDIFYPEESEFTQIRTIRTWVSEVHHSNEELMRKIQRDAAMSVPENPYSLNWIIPVQNNSDDQRYFGRCFPTIAASELPFLQYVHKISQDLDQPVILEIAAGVGTVSWKVPFTFKDRGIFYVNELSENMLKMFDAVVEKRLPENLSSKIRKVAGDCFEIPTICPELVGSVNVIYVQNLEHFFNPTQHQRFLALLNLLLAPGGRVFLTAHTLKPTHYRNKDAVFKTYCTYKEQETYPGFISYTLTTELTDDAAQSPIGRPIISEIQRPGNNDECLTGMLSSESIGSKIIEGRQILVKRVTMRVTENFYTPEIYEDAIKPLPLLKITDAFYINHGGERFENYTDSPNVSFSSVVIEKEAS